MSRPFTDRVQGGRELAVELGRLHDAGELPDPLVLALPRGGVPVAREVARELRAPLDVLVARKIGCPGRPEFGVGALAGDDPPVYDREALAVLGLTEDRMAPVASREREELRRREALYRGDRPEPAVTGRTAVVVDDGLATGVTARAALRLLRGRHPALLVLAVPVGAAQTVRAMDGEADLIVCPLRPDPFHAVGLWYEDFPQVSDAEVVAALHSPASG
jgi:putative phosphoribosyl transferase